LQKVSPIIRKNAYLRFGDKMQRRTAVWSRPTPMRKRREAEKNKKKKKKKKRGF
jgi:hypothetical protein